MSRRKGVAAVSLAVAVAFAVAGTGCETESREVQEASEPTTRENRSPDSPTGLERNPAQPQSERPTPPP